MSAALDYDAGDPYYSASVGPQNDGTYVIPYGTGAVMPYDAGGGPSANYAPQVLDLFKFGVGVWQQQANQSAMLDYRRYEATNGGLYLQGSAANGRLAVRGNNQLVMLLMVAAAVYLVAK